MINESINKNIIYEENGLIFTEIIRQEYTGNNCIIYAGFVKGENKPEVDTIYVRLEKDKAESGLLRPKYLGQFDLQTAKERRFKGLFL